MKVQESFLENYISDGQEPVFAEPWMARAFALTVKLHQQEVFTWSRWGEYLSDTISANESLGYYECWLLALEGVLRDKNVVGSEEYLQKIGEIHET